MAMAREDFSDRLENAAHEAEARLEAAARQWRSAADAAGEGLAQVETYVRQHPLAAMAVALGAGFLIGALAVRR